MASDLEKGYYLNIQDFIKAGGGGGGGGGTFNPSRDEYS